LKGLVVEWEVFFRELLGIIVLSENDDESFTVSY
jgi:hypothetical protein